MIDWTTIITAVIAIVSVESVLRAVDHYRHKKEDKKLKKDEVQKAETDTDKQQIDLGDLFLQKTQKWAEIIEQNSEKTIRKIDENNAKRDNDWRELKADMVYVKKEVSSISEYLNGDYQDFKKKKGAANVNKAKKAQVPRKRGWKPEEQQ